MLLAGDIGGTKTVLAIYSAQADRYSPLVQQTYSSIQYSSLESMIQEFLHGRNVPITSACFGVAGPISARRAHITNLPWVIDANRLKAIFEWAAVDLINDLEAVAYAIPILPPENVFELKAGKPEPGGSISVLAPGTGLGEAFLTIDNGKSNAHACEGGHASFAPMNPLQMGLLRYLWEQKGFDHVSYEQVCSGRLGIPNLYDYLKEIRFAEEPAWLAEALASTDDPTPVVVSAALSDERPSKLCQGVLDLFVSILGAEAGNQALKVMATGGIYLGGGIPPRILSKLKETVFLEAIIHKGRFRSLLDNIPVRVILNSQAGLIGAAAFGLDRRSAQQNK